MSRKNYSLSQAHSIIADRLRCPCKILVLRHFIISTLQAKQLDCGLQLKKLELQHTKWLTGTKDVCQKTIYAPINLKTIHLSIGVLLISFTMVRS